ncbi:MAG: NADH-quinone oxidoreductase subunit J [Euryarchaeota archaeon]|nr:NADH-quinone oxidoreductase subunit J [Euryarchaeota archaeon]
MEQISGDIGKILNLIVMLLLIVALVFAITSSVGNLGPPASLEYLVWEDGSKDVSGIEHIGSIVFGEQVVPFEILSLILLAALISGAYMAKKEI